MSVRSPRTFRFFVSVVRLAALAIICSFAMPSVARAQDKSSHWGVRVTLIPGWELHDSVRNLLLDENEEGTIKGTEFAIGFVRGRMDSGDWGVSFVRKPYDSASGFISNDQDCFNQAQTICRPNTELTRFDNVYLNAFEVHKFIAFAHITRRAQVGLNVAGGFGTLKGNIVTITDRFEPTGFNQNGPTGFVQRHEEEVKLANDELFLFRLLIKLEAEGAITVARGVKVKIAGGLNFPSVGFRVGVVYLIGAK